jgi:RNA polymerase sigma-70 factor (ECF subfamily)
MPELNDAELVNLARDGDPVAFRLLVERHQPMVRARAGQLCANPSDTDDVVQETFLRAFIALDRLREPGKVAAWLAGITANVCRGLWRGDQPALLPDWPESLHPVAADGVPSADDIDRVDAVRAAMAELSALQRQTVVKRYYQDDAAGAGAARASLHKARRRMRAYLTEHRPDLVPRRPQMTTVRIARVGLRDPEHGPRGPRAPRFGVILADEEGRELPVWLLNFDGLRLRRLSEAADTADALTARMLRAIGSTVTGVEIGELGPEVTAARITIDDRQVTARVVEGLAVAIATGAPVRVADAVMDRLAVPAGTTPIREPGRKPNARPVPRRSNRPRYSPRNLTFADGLNGWRFGGSFAEHLSESHWRDYISETENGTAAIASAVPEPAGFAMLGQEVYAEDYRDSLVTFRAEFRVTSDRAGLFLRVNEGRPIRGPLTEQAAFADPDNNATIIAPDPEWTSHEVSARVPPDGDIILFGIFLAGSGRLEMRRPELRSLSHEHLAGAVGDERRRAARRGQGLHRRGGNRHDRWVPGNRRAGGAGHR